MLRIGHPPLLPPGGRRKPGCDWGWGVGAVETLSTAAPSHQQVPVPARSRSGRVSFSALPPSTSGKRLLVLLALQKTRGDLIQTESALAAEEIEHSTGDQMQSAPDRGGGGGGPCSKNLSIPD